MAEQPQAYQDASTGFIPTSEVIVDREARQRRTLGKDIDELAEQIAAVGRLIHPIVIRADNTLVAGERRLEAHKKLGWPLIEYRRFESLPYMEAYKIELLENIARRQLSWQDEVLAVSKYHQMRLQTVGPMWTIMGTAGDLSLSKSTVQRYIEVAKLLGDAEVAGCQTLDGAFNLIKGRAERARAAAANRGIEVASAALNLPTIDPAASASAKGRAISEMLKISLEPPTAVDTSEIDIELIHSGAAAAESLRLHAEAEAAAQAQAATSPIITGSFLDWAPLYDGPPFDVLHVDFPYGKEYAGSNTRKTGRAHIAPTYADSPDVYWELIETLITYQDALAYPIAHMLFWFDMSFYQATIDTFTNAGWTLAQPFPLIWAKPAQGVASDHKRRPRHVYETALLFSRGDRKLVKVEQDVAIHRKEEALHINQKDARMLQQFLSMLVDEHTAVFDPTCGSGSALAVAKRLGAPRILGVELDSANAEVARFVVRREEQSKAAGEEEQSDEAASE